MKKVSIIMAVYKEERDELDSSINSILNQTYRNIEFIIIIDNPNDDWRKKFIEEKRDSRIKLIVNEENLGLPKSLNIGIQYATGDYIARMDADDISLKNRIENQIKYLEEKKCDLCGSNFSAFFYDDDNKLICNPKNHKNIYKIMRYTNCIGHPTWFGKKEIFINNGGYRNIFSCEDYDFLLRAINKGYKLANVPEILLRYRLSEKSISRSNTGRQIMIANYLAKEFRNYRIPSLEDINDFLKSKQYLNNVKRYNKYYEIKKKRNNYISNKFPSYYINTCKLILYSNFFIRDICLKLYLKLICKLDSKEKE